MGITRRISKGVTFHKRDDRLPCPGGYALHMYCQYFNIEHGHNEFPHIFDGENFSEAYKEAKSAGWTMDDKHYGTCPKCNRFLKQIGTANDGKVGPES